MKQIREMSPPINLNGPANDNSDFAIDSKDHREIKASKRQEPIPIVDNKKSDITAPSGPPRFKITGSLV